MHHYKDDAAMHTARDGQNDGNNARSSPDPYQDTPYYLRVKVKGGVLWLSRQQCIDILRRGRRWRKVMANWNPKRSA